VQEEHDYGAGAVRDDSEVGYVRVRHLPAREHIHTTGPARKSARGYKPLPVSAPDGYLQVAGKPGTRWQPPLDASPRLRVGGVRVDQRPCVPPTWSLRRGDC
jgi:hypothetical protein